MGIPLRYPVAALGQGDPAALALLSCSIMGAVVSLCLVCMAPVVLAQDSEVCKLPVVQGHQQQASGMTAWAVPFSLAAGSPQEERSNIPRASFRSWFWKVTYPVYPCFRLLSSAHRL